MIAFVKIMFWKGGMGQFQYWENDGLHFVNSAGWILCVLPKLIVTIL